MQQPKRGNGHHAKRVRHVQRHLQHMQSASREPVAVSEYAPASPRRREPASLTLHEDDLVTGEEENLYTLFYECYRGYTIYSTEQGTCCIHGHDGCLRLQGKYVCFPDIEQAKNMIKYFQSKGHTSRESMNRFVPRQVYVCLNGEQVEKRQAVPQRHLVAV